jgi:electron transport complex protein RnfA
MSNIFLDFFTVVIASNIVFTYGIGCENADESSTGVVSALKYGAMFTIAAAAATALKWVANTFVIERFALEYLKAPLYILSVVISVLVTRLLASLILPKIYGNREIGEGLVADFALVGIVFIFNPIWGGLLMSVLAAVLAAVGVVLASLIFALIKEKLEFSNVPKCMRGLPIMLVSAGIIALVFAELRSVIYHFLLS